MRVRGTTLSEPQPRFGDNFLGIRLINHCFCWTRNATIVLDDLRGKGGGVFVEVRRSQRIRGKTLLLRACKRNEQ